MYLSIIEPTTPKIITGQIARLKTICKRIITVNADGRGKGVISISIEITYTRTYCHHIVSILFNCKVMATFQVFRKLPILSSFINILCL